MIIIGKGSLNHEYFEKGLKVLVNLLKNDTSITRYLDDYVYVEEGTTIADIFAILSNYEEDVDFAFDSSLGGYPFSLYLDEIHDEHEPDTNLIFAEFSHEVSFEGGQLTDNARFGAIGLDPTANKDLVSYSIELSPIATYKHLEVRLNYDFKIYKVDDDKEDLLFEASKPFTLYELIHALLYEISYHGTPEMRAEVMQDLTDKITSGGDLSGSSVANMKEIELAKLKTELQDAVDREEFENAAEIRDKISKLEKCKSENDRNKQ